MQSRGGGVQSRGGVCSEELKREGKKGRQKEMCGVEERRSSKVTKEGVCSQEEGSGLS